MADREGRMLNSREVAFLLDLSPDTVIEFARCNIIPAFKKGRQWRFRQSDVRSVKRQLRGSIPPRSRGCVVAQRARPSPFEPGSSSHVVAKLLLDLRLPRLWRRPIAFTKTLAASAIPPLDETRS